MAMISYHSVTSWPGLEQEPSVRTSLTLSVTFFVILFVTFIVTHLLNFSSSIMGKKISSSIQTRKMTMMMIMMMITDIVIIIIMIKGKADDLLNGLFSPTLFFEWFCVVTKWMVSLTTWRCIKIVWVDKQAETIVQSLKMLTSWKCIQNDLKCLSSRSLQKTLKLTLSAVNCQCELCYIEVTESLHCSLLL